MAFTAVASTAWRALLAAFVLLSLTLGAGDSLAQSISGVPAAEPSSAAEAPTAPDPTGALVEVLRDPAARDRLIAELERLANAETGGEAPAEAPAETPEDTLPPSLSRQAAEATLAIVGGIQDRLATAWRQLQFLPTRLQNFDEALDPEVLRSALTDLGIVIAVTYTVFLALRLATASLIRRFANEARERGLIRRFGFAGLAALVDALTIAAAYALGYAITLSVAQDLTSVASRQSLYLNAFLVAETVKLAGRFILAPRHPSFRLVPLPDTAVQSLWLWFRVVVTVTVYVELLAVPIIRAEAGFFAGSALSTVASTLMILLTLAAVFRRRRAVARWLMPKREGEEAGEATGFIGTLVGFWHWPVLAYLLFLLGLVLTRPGNVVLPFLWASSQVAGVLLLGIFAIRGLSAAASRGVRLPQALSARLPLLEERLNLLIPNSLSALRLLVGVITVALALDIMGYFDVTRWLAGATGTALTATLGSVLLLLGVVFFIWLAFSAWVDYRLNPYYGKPPTPREATLLGLLRNAVTIVLAILTLMLVMSEVGLDIAPLLASAGVLGLAIGFGAQKLVQDIITGVFIQFENAMNVGDVVTVGGITGSVEKLTVRSVSLRDLQGVFHIIPFSSVDSVSNFTRNFSYHVADMGIAYREDIEQAKSAMHEAFEELKAMPEHRRAILGSLEWFGLNSFGDSAIVLRARIKTLPGQQWGVGRAYNEILKRLFDSRGIEIPFPHQTLYFGEDRSGKAPPLHIRIAAEAGAAPLPEAPTALAAGGSYVPGEVNAPDEAER